MTTEQIKAKINQALETVPESMLSEVLAYINDLKESSNTETARLKRLKRILDEDSDVLQRLAK